MSKKGQKRKVSFLLLSLCLCVWLSVCLCLCLSLCLSVSLSLRSITTLGNTPTNRTSIELNLEAHILPNEYPSFNLKFCALYENPNYSVFIVLHHFFTLRKNLKQIFSQYWNGAIQFWLELGKIELAKFEFVFWLKSMKRVADNFNEEMLSCKSETEIGQEHDLNQKLKKASQNPPTTP